MKRVIFASIIALSLVACNKEESKQETNNEVINSDIAVDPTLFGEWKGNIELPNSPLEIIVSLNETTGALSVPIQGIANLQAESIKLNGNQFEMAITLQGQKIEIEGTLHEGKIKGTFSQNGGTFPISLTHVEQGQVTNETYEMIDIPVQGGTLKAALQLSNDKPTDIAIIVAGSGPTNKDGNAVGMTNNSYKMLAEGLAEQGIASIRYDKRGIGDNIQLVNDPTALTIDDFAKDVASIVQYVQNDGRFSEVHIIGHSEGALLASIAAQQQQVDSIILLAGAGRTIDEVILEQLSAQLPPSLLEESQSIFATLKLGQTVDSISNELQSLFAKASQPYLMSWLKYNPVTELENAKTKKYVLQGTTDLQVSVADAQKLGEVADEVMIIEGMNHFLKKAPLDRAENLATYTNAELALHPDILPAIVELIE
ncbi:alpha/beta fold hydrolase [Solibacillus sp. CAU 1738]|uniref:alpha/beta hydrolase n=1 Tax=Solibacillus sp. CAU 1738 TaxID=3140363 RepID=UPI0032601C0A